MRRKGTGRKRNNRKIPVDVKNSGRGDGDSRRRRGALRTVTGGTWGRAEEKVDNFELS